MLIRKNIVLAISLVFTSILFAGPLSNTDREFIELKNAVITQFKNRNVNADITELEKLAEKLDISRFGLGPGVFSYWRKETSKLGIKDLKKTCSYNKMDSTEISAVKMSSDQYVKYQTRESAPLTVVSLQMAEKVFQILKGQDYKLVFTEYGTGCESRAHRMAQLIDEFCINSAKAFIESPTIQLPGHAWSWYYHVAPILMVKTDDGVIPYIMDPAVFDHAEPLTKWVEYLRAEHYYNEYLITLTSKYILFPIRKDNTPQGYTEPDEWFVKKKIWQRQGLRFIRPFLGPIEGKSKD